MNQLAPAPSSSFPNPSFQYSHTPPPGQPQGTFIPPPPAGQSLGYGASSSHGAGARPPSAGMMQGTPFDYSSAPSQSTPAPFPQYQLQQQIRASASPPYQQQPQARPSPPNAALSNPTPPNNTIKYPMAAPPLPNTPGSTTNTTAQSPPKTPLSPTSENLEKTRIAHLLTLNSALLSEISALQSSGAGGVLNPAQAEAARQKGLPDKMASEDYIHTMRRVQANLQYLMSKQNHTGGGGEGGAKQLPGPAIMTAPPHLGERLRGEYERLRELFPEWSGVDARAGMGTPGRQNSGQAPQGQQQMGQQQQQQ